ncbi:hypothetical protein O9992_20405 [Vibrio lentus]|nr:hypothetical protein [Vibrio lentus]
MPQWYYRFRYYFAEEMTAQVGSDPIAYQTSNNSFLVMLGFALVGGLISNICAMCSTRVRDEAKTASFQIKRCF